MPHKDPERRKAYQKQRWQKIVKERNAVRIAQGLPLDLRGKVGHPSPFKGMTYEQIYGKEKAENIQSE